ncbi:MAG TPA: cation diffusion facilitator family transporter [Caulobacteraceae bacterium]|nr:cation diffusion facilitator family transporter [Caulobacteraceae bacterium]
MNQAYALSPAETAKLTRRVTSYSVATASVLALLKGGVWLASGSVSILASLADSGLDLIAALGTFFAVRYAVAPPDREHRYGHGKAEAFASLVQAGLVFASAALIGEEAIRRFAQPQPVRDSGWAIAAMAVSTVLTFALITAQGRVLKQVRSVAVTGDRAHYVADLASNVLALLAIAAASLFGFNGFDAIGGLAVAAILLWGAVGVFRESSNELMDHELPDEARARIVELMTQDPRLTDVHQLRTRASGPIVHIQMHADLDPQLTLEIAHQVVVAAEKRVLEAFPAADIIIHADPRGRAEPHGGAFAEMHASVEG